MKTIIRAIAIVVTGSLVALAVSLCALPTAAVAQPSTSVTQATAPLQDAYYLLAHADHDYKGHRVKAMRQIEAAGKLLGVTLGGQSRIRENQGASDAQLRQAQTLLNQAAGSLSGKPLKHVQNAVNQLSVALSIR
jgi:hypothetical protein